MPAPAQWHPVVPSHSLRAGYNLVAARALGQDLVVWRSDAGVAQVWLDRCPHRGVRLSLGRMLDGRLSCAYHGWEFAADSGRCLRIPALADRNTVPGQVRARAFPVREAQQMVWVQLPDEAQAADIDAAPGADTQPATAVFVRSMAVRAPLDTVHAMLARHRFTPHAGNGWDGDLAQAPARVFTLAAQPDLTLLHVFLHAALDRPNPAAEPSPAGLSHLADSATTFEALRRLRAGAEVEATAGAL